MPRTHVNVSGQCSHSMLRESGQLNAWRLEAKRPIQLKD